MTQCSKVRDHKKAKQEPVYSSGMETHVFGLGPNISCQNAFQAGVEAGLFVKGTSGKDVCPYTIEREHPNRVHHSGHEHTHHHSDHGGRHERADDDDGNSHHRRRRGEKHESSHSKDAPNLGSGPRICSHAGEILRPTSEGK